MKLRDHFGQHCFEPIRVMGSGGERIFETNFFIVNSKDIVIDRDLAALAAQAHGVAPLIRPPRQKNLCVAPRKMES